MKPFLILSIILTNLSLEGKCQSSNDTLCFKISEVKNLLIAAKQKKYADSLVLVYRSDVNILSQKVAALEIKDSTNKEINNTYQAMVGTMKDQRVILENQITYLNKEVKKQKRKTTLTAISGILLTSLTAFLFLTK